MGVKGDDLKAGAKAKLDDAVLLLKNGRFGDAYYLAGYAVEFALKACIAGLFAKGSIPPLSYVREIYTHDLSKLVRLAGLESERQKQERADPTFATYWGVVGQWDEESRYFPKTAMEAQLLLQAIGDPKSGVLSWIGRFL